MCPTSFSSACLHRLIISSIKISGKRRLQVSDFKGQNFINIREFYEKDGKTLPGRKGIALNIEQYAAFIALMPEIEAVLKDKGIDVPRPQYDAGSSQKVSDAEDEEDDDDEEKEDEDEEEG